MKYLLYFKDGFLKKFPLHKPSFTIGRDTKNDLTIDEDYVSRRHLEVKVKDDHIIIQDQNSRNGTYVRGRHCREAIIKIGDSFSLMETEFILKQGSLNEFRLSKDLLPVFEKLKKESIQQINNLTTKYSKNAFSELLSHILQVGLKKNNFNELLQEISTFLSGFKQIGNIFLICKSGRKKDIMFSIKRARNIMVPLKTILGIPDIFKKEHFYHLIPGDKNRYFYSQPLGIHTSMAVLVYIPVIQTLKENKKTSEFVRLLASELSLLAKTLNGKKPVKKVSQENSSQDIKIIYTSRQMDKLVQQTKKIARTNLFVLIQGESGTGKELFAKLIHCHSSRKNGHYVALNCAAIPDNLLEAELFGHEKGAFSGAVNQRKGKLELASGGTLILDEISEMPIHLQAKFLRVLQEQEFYRLGGSLPIKIDLRVISISNSNLKQKLAEGKFRADLYYRLAHHTLSVPPLRERREDIPELINYFTRKYGQINSKYIRGYSVKAFETLQNHTWSGNVRQLENEINRIVNLVDEEEAVGFEILSEDLKAPDPDFGHPAVHPSMVFDKEYEKKAIIDLLVQNNWNKSKTAKQINMTYRGLHEKMKRMGIIRKDS